MRMNVKLCLALKCEKNLRLPFGRPVVPLEQTIKAVSLIASTSTGLYIFMKFKIIFF